MSENRSNLPSGGTVNDDGEGMRIVEDATDYKNPGLLVRSLSEGGRMMPSRVTGMSFKMQRKKRMAILRARYLALLPYVRK